MLVSVCISMQVATDTFLSKERYILAKKNGLLLTLLILYSLIPAHATEDIFLETAYIVDCWTLYFAVTTMISKDRRCRAIIAATMSRTCKCKGVAVVVAIAVSVAVAV